MAWQVPEHRGAMLERANPKPDSGSHFAGFSSRRGPKPEVCCLVTAEAMAQPSLCAAPTPSCSSKLLQTPTGRAKHVAPA